MTETIEEVKAILYEEREGVAYVTLNRPQALNAINLQMLDELEQMAEFVRTRDQVKVVVIRGSGGRAFSAGADLKELQRENMMDDAGKHLNFSAKLRDALNSVEQIPVPVVAVIEGYAMAGGLELALTCDLILCTSDSQISDQHANRNLIAGGGGTQRLPRRIGVQRAMELLFTGRRLSGDEAVEYGIALSSCTPSELDDEVEKLVAQLRDKSRVGLRLMKQLVKRGMELPLREALDIERLVVQEYFSCYPDAKGGVQAFNDSRPTA